MRVVRALYVECLSVGDIRKGDPYIAIPFGCKIQFQIALRNPAFGSKPDFLNRDAIEIVKINRDVWRNVVLCYIELYAIAEKA